MFEWLAEGCETVHYCYQTFALGKVLKLCPIVAAENSAKLTDAPHIMKEHFPIKQYIQRL